MRVSGRIRFSAAFDELPEHSEISSSTITGPFGQVVSSLLLTKKN